MKGYITNIEQDTIENTDYRRVLHTGQQMQLVVMSLKAGEEIPAEVHSDIDQFIRIEKGEAIVRIDGEEQQLKDDDIVIIPANTEHYVKNISETDDLKLYSIYTPPEHPPETVHTTKAEADAAEEEHHH